MTVATTETSNEITGDTTMKELLSAYPGAQRALFAKYHIGGCQSCGFQPEETVAQVCARNEDLPVEGVIGHVKNSHDADVKIQISPTELSEFIKTGKAKIIDVRTREEHDAVKIPASELMNETLLQTIFSSWDKETTIVVYDHTGKRSMDAAAYLLGHGYMNTKSLLGGIDAYSREIDASLPRYKIEME
jgi:rhodanese-related sulfurtransferase